MGLEIERKFLLANNKWRKNANSGNSIKQGYLNSHIERTVRVRVTKNKSTLNVKGKTAKTTRLEYEYEIPLLEAEQLLELCEKPIIEKTRYEIVENGNLWEVDEFEGDNSGLIIAEIELESEDQEVILPQWIGEEVSDDTRYYNSSLMKHPFKDW